MTMLYTLFHLLTENHFKKYSTRFIKIKEICLRIFWKFLSNFRTFLLVQYCCFWYFRYKVSYMNFSIKFQRSLKFTKVIELILLNESNTGIPRDVSSFMFAFIFLAKKNFYLIKKILRKL